MKVTLPESVHSVKSISMFSKVSIKGHNNTITIRHNETIICLLCISYVASCRVLWHESQKSHERNRKGTTWPQAKRAKKSCHDDDNRLRLLLLHLRHNERINMNTLLEGRTTMNLSREDQPFYELAKEWGKSRMKATLIRGRQKLTFEKAQRPNTRRGGTPLERWAVDPTKRPFRPGYQSLWRTAEAGTMKILTANNNKNRNHWRSTLLWIT